MESSLVLAILALILAPAAAICLMLLVRRTAPEGSYFSDSDRAGAVFGVLATGFSVLLGLIVVLAFASFDESRNGARVEAELVIQQYQTAQFLPQPQGGVLASELTCYGRYVVNREWGQMESGDATETGNPWGVAMFLTLRDTEPGTAAEEAAFSKWMDQTSERQVARLDRLQGAQGIIAPALWVVLLLTAAVIVAYMMLFADSGERALSQAMLIGTVVLVVTATMILIRVLENPYSFGTGALEPTAMESTLRVLGEFEAIADQAPLPCDANGVLLTQ